MQSLRRLATLALGWAWICLSPAIAETIRVTTWNLQWFPSGSPKMASPEVEAERIHNAAKTIALLNPDVLILQEVRDHAACVALANALTPTAKYHVLVCSAFKDPFGAAPGGQQVAILSKKQGDAAWAEKWADKGPVDPPRGFAFAVIPFGKKRVGFYSVHLKSNLARGDREREEQMNLLKRETSAERLLEHTKQMQKDHANLVGFVVAGDFNTNVDDPKFVSEQTLRSFEKAKFKNPILALPQAKRITWPSDGKFPDATFDYVLLRNLIPIGGVEILKNSASDHRPVTLEFKLR
jgi:endonuclease/exonuclease/phosphatase family metal-dependent hydrolase